MPDFGRDPQRARPGSPDVASPGAATAAGKPGRVQFSTGGTIPPVAGPSTGAPPPPAPTASERGYDKPAAETPTPDPTAKPTTLKAILEQNHQTLESIKTQTWTMQSVAKQLLQAKGVDNPAQSQVDETLFQMSKAIEGGNWESFEAPFGSQAIKLEDGVNERLGNIFFEKKVFTEDELKPENLKIGESDQRKLRGGYESGVSGMVMAASFINTRHRSEGDFSHAYGDEAWKGFVRAEAYLESIPKGKFLEELSVEMMMEVNRLIHAPDTGLKAKMLRTMAMIGRGGRWDHGGELREGRQYARPEQYGGEEIENLKEAGIHVNQLTHREDGGGYAGLEYPKPEEVKPTLDRLIAELKADVALPNADPIGAAAKFQRHFVALHPFGDSNGRTSRILMNRILAEFDMPPAILADQNKDISLSPAEWRTEVAKGVARSKTFLTSKRVESKENYLGNMGIKAMDASPDKPITLDGNPFDLGQDGLLYDPTGRPWIVEGNEVIPMAQLEHYVMARRIFQSGKDAGNDMLKKTTEATRALYAKVSADPEAGKGIVVRDDAQARKADESYKLSPEPEVAKMLTDLSDPSTLDPKTAFRVNGARGTDVSSTLSKYAQMDLEFWYVERGLRERGQDELVDKIRQHRAKLFEMAHAELETHKDASRVSPENPMGFRFKYEKMMYDTSPLRFTSFAEALGELGDKKITVWRGDYSFARIIGMAPNNDIRQPDAKKVASERADKSQLTNVYDDLVKLEGSAVGRQYICTTSDLALLTHAFANSEKGQTVSINSLPGPIKERLLAWIAPDFPEGTTDADKQAARKVADERGDKVLPSANGGKEIRDAFGIPGTIITVRVVDKAAGKVEVTAPRKAFQMTVDKDSVLPGVYALGGPSFESEQEMHGLERISPFSIKSTYKADALNEEFPVNGAAAPAPAATTTPAG